MFDTDKLSEMNVAIQEVVNTIQEGKIYNSQKRNAEESLTSLKHRLNELNDQLRKEEKDVDKLQSISFSNLFHSLINDKPEKLSKEAQEVLTVKAQIDSLQYEIVATEERIKVLEGKLSEVVDAKKRYEELFQQKKDYIEAEIPDKWKEIDSYTHQIYDLTLNQKELTEALTAGRMVMSCIEGIQDSLNSAEGWGMYDIIGGGLLSTMVKRNHMDVAQNQIHELKHKLTTFDQELSDVGTALDVNLGLDDFLGFADWFFDGLFVDIAVQSKINNAIDQIESLRNKVDSIICRLENDYKTITTKATTMQNECDDFIKSI
ncbi:MAG: hypothetical protein CVU84_09220 [Firmicutes bacterium HGW-Firmicutes-1]|nr:MAG: hypothetical protein CVU84_09220 [Firmicutes bacterium HGW-Firmicutes-1]